MMHAKRRGLRLAVAVSVGLHLSALAAVAVLSRRPTGEVHAAARIDTRIGIDKPLRWHAPDVDVSPPAPPVSPVVTHKIPVAEAKPTPPVEAIGQRPTASSAPRTLPANVLARIRSHANASAPEAASESPPAAIQPVVFVAPPAVNRAAPLHGSLAQGQTIVYLLDASGSMGQGGRFDRARRALLATLRNQSPQVRFQVIVYAGFARSLFPGGCLPARADAIALAAQHLMAVEPLGRSDHEAALRLAGTFNPEFILVLTDGDDLPSQAVHELLARLARPPMLTLALVGSEGVAPPRAMK